MRLIFKAPEISIHMFLSAETIETTAASSEVTGPQLDDGRMTLTKLENRVRSANMQQALNLMEYKK